MEIKANYRTGEVAKLSSCSVTTVKSIADIFTRIIPYFVSRDSRGRIYNERALSAIQYVVHFSNKFSEEDTYKTAINIFYNLDCNDVSKHL